MKSSPSSVVARRLLEQDPFQTFPATVAWEKVRARVIACTLDIAAELAGAGVRAELEQVGLARMHEAFPVGQLEQLRAELGRRLSLPLFQWAADVSRDVLGFRGEFFLDEKIYFRINYPFEVAMRGPKPAQPEGELHRLIATARKLRSADAVKDRVFNAMRGKGFVPTLDLVRYNRNRPQATWAHGPHIDTWYGHAFGSINFWWAISGVNERNSMVIYPDSHKRSFPFDKENMYLEKGIRTPAPRALSMHDGELALFDAELLHSTRLNTSDQTRFVITLRVNESEPAFSADTTHAIYDRWHSSQEIDAGVLRPRRRGRRVPHRPYPRFTSPPAKVFHVDARYERSQRYEVCAMSELEEMNVVQFHNLRLLLFRHGDQVRCTGSVCPHVARPLEDGHLIDGRIQCPAHGVRFRVDSGESDCAQLRLRTYNAVILDGTVHVVP